MTQSNALEVDERQPLLAAHQDAQSKTPDAGLPWGQVAVLAIWRATHAIYFGFILTWITRFLISNKLANETSVGKVAGIIESAYSLGVLTGLAPASYLSDSWGRKPTAICGILCASVGTMCFGFAWTIPQLIAIRFFNGFFIAFLPASILTTLRELANPRTLPMAITVYTIAWRFGMLTAPFVGGFLAEPATHYPKLFGGTIWESYPYALSGIVAASIPLLATAIGIFILKETLPMEQRRSVPSCLSRGEQPSTHDLGTTQKQFPLRAMFTKPVCFMLFLWGFYVFMQLTNAVAEVLFLSSPTSVGGLGFAPREMAIVYTARPVLASLSNLLLYPPLSRRYKPETIFRWGLTLNNTTYYGLYFAFGLFAAQYHPSHGLSLFILYFLSIPLGIGGTTAGAAIQTLFSRAPSKEYNARMSTAQEYVLNAGHGLGSAVGSYPWALGVTYGILHGQAVWLFLFLTAIILAGLASLLTEQKSREDNDSDSL